MRNKKSPSDWRIRPERGWEGGMFKSENALQHFHFSITISEEFWNANRKNDFFYEKTGFLYFPLAEYCFFEYLSALNEDYLSGEKYNQVSSVVDLPYMAGVSSQSKIASAVLEIDATIFRCNWGGMALHSFRYCIPGRTSKAGRRPAGDCRSFATDRDYSIVAGGFNNWAWRPAWQWLCWELSPFCREWRDRRKRLCVSGR